MKTICNIDNGKMMIGPVAVSFPALFHPTSRNEVEKKKYSAHFLIEKGSEIEKKIRAAGFGSILLDGSSKADKYPEYANMLYINAKSDRAPVIKDKNNAPLLEEAEMYGGCLVYASLNTYTNSYGTFAGLRGVMKVADGEPFGGDGGNANNDFDRLSVPSTDDEDF